MMIADYEYHVDLSQMNKENSEKLNPENLHINKDSKERLTLPLTVQTSPRRSSQGKFLYSPTRQKVSKRQPITDSPGRPSFSVISKYDYTPQEYSRLHGINTRELRRHSEKPQRTTSQDNSQEFLSSQSKSPRARSEYSKKPSDYVHGRQPNSPDQLNNSRSHSTSSHIEYLKLNNTQATTKHPKDPPTKSHSRIDYSKGATTKIHPITDHPKGQTMDKHFTTEYPKDGPIKVNFATKYLKNRPTGTNIISGTIVQSQNRKTGTSPFSKFQSIILYSKGPSLANHVSGDRKPQSLLSTTESLATSKLVRDPLMVSLIHTLAKSKTPDKPKFTSQAPDDKIYPYPMTTENTKDTLASSNTINGNPASWPESVSQGFSTATIPSYSVSSTPIDHSRIPTDETQFGPFTLGNKYSSVMPQTPETIKVTTPSKGQQSDSTSSIIKVHTKMRPSPHSNFQSRTTGPTTNTTNYNDKATSGSSFGYSGPFQMCFIDISTVCRVDLLKVRQSARRVEISEDKTVDIVWLCPPTEDQSVDLNSPYDWYQIPRNRSDGPGSYGTALPSETDVASNTSILEIKVHP